MWLVTAGPTREHLDEVRFLSNASSGRMGFALAAEAARRRGGAVLVSGPVALPTPPGVERIDVVSAAEMLAACRRVLASGRIHALFAAAAVCDLRPARRLAGKPGKGALPTSLELVENPDVVATLAGEYPGLACFGFALEDLSSGFERALAKARAKLAGKGLRAVALNGPEAIEEGQAEVWWVPDAGQPEALGRASKEVLAARLLDRACALLDSRGGGAAPPAERS